MEKLICSNCGMAFIPNMEDEYKEWCNFCNKAYKLSEKDGLQRMVGKSDFDKLKELQIIRKDLYHKERIMEEIEKLKVECGNCGEKFIPETELEKKSFLDKGLLPDIGFKKISHPNTGQYNKIRCSLCDQAYGLNNEDGLKRMAGKNNSRKLKELQLMREEIENKERIKKDTLFSGIIQKFKEDVFPLNQYGSCKNSIDDFEKLCIEDRKLLISKVFKEETRDIINIINSLVTNYNPELKPFLKLNFLSHSIQEDREFYQKCRQFFEKEDYQNILDCCLKAYELDRENSPLLHNIGLIYSYTGHPEKAIEYFEKAVAVLIGRHGEQHHLVIESYNEIALALQKLGQYRKSTEYFKKAVYISIDIHGETYADTADFYHETAKAYFNCGDYAKAIFFNEKSLSIRLALYGKKHLDVASSWSSLGSCWWKLAHQKRAVEYHGKPVTDKSRMYGIKYTNTAISLKNPGSVWKNLEEYHKAVDYYEKALDSILTILGEEHPAVAANWSNLGSVWKDLGDYKKAIDYFEKALRVRVTKLGKEHKDTINTERLLSEAHETLKNH